MPGSSPRAALLLVAALAIAFGAAPSSIGDIAPRQSDDWIDAFREPATRIISEALSSDFAWQRLAELGDTFGPRLSGSPGLEQAIGWAADQMRKDGLENVRLEPVLVPRWVVLFTNEENGLRGALAYRDRHQDELANHVLMLESDAGAFRPLAFGFTGGDRARATVTRIASLLRAIGVDHVGPSGGGADIGPSVRAAGIPSMSLAGDSGRYFTVHHTPADTVDKIDPGDVARAAAAVAVMIYVVAEMPERLPRE